MTSIPGECGSSSSRTPSIVTDDGPTVGAILDEARSGAVVVLSASESPKALTLGELAARALTWALRERGGGGARVVELVGEPELDARSSSCGTFGEHELGWLRAGVAYEGLLTTLEESGNFTHVFCLDPWAATVRRKLLPDAKWVFVSDLEHRRQSKDAEYWEQYEAWIGDLPFECVIGARSLLPFLPPSTWTPGDGADLRSGLRATAGSRIIVIDEASDARPAPEVLRAALRKWGEEGRVVLLTPHLHHYLASCPDALERCCMALGTADLAVPVYAALLNSADVYVAPTRLPFGAGPLAALTDESEATLPRESLECLPEGVARLVRPHDGPGQLAASLNGGGDSKPSQAAAPHVAPGSEAPYARWWRQLSGLIRHTDGAEAPAGFGILTCCYKYLQRFRVFLDSVARQDYPLERVEVCVAAPGNPDGLLEYLDLFRLAHPELAIRVADVPEGIRANRGKMINAAFRVSSSPVLMVADGDIVLPPHFVRRMVETHDPRHVVGCWRTPLGDEVAAHIITGNLDPVSMFDALRDRWDPREQPGVREGVLGYCQVVSRKAFEEVMYPEEFDRMNQSDIVFVDRLRERLGITPKLRKDLFVLHLAHPRDWSGTKVFL